MINLMHVIPNVVLFIIFLLKGTMISLMHVILNLIVMQLKNTQIKVSSAGKWHCLNSPQNCPPPSPLLLQAVNKSAQFSLFLSDYLLFAHELKQSHTSFHLLVTRSSFKVRLTFKKPCFP